MLTEHWRQVYRLRKKIDLLTCKKTELLREPQEKRDRRYYRDGGEDDVMPVKIHDGAFFGPDQA